VNGWENLRDSDFFKGGGVRVGKKDTRINNVYTPGIMMQDYNVTQSEGDDERSPPKLELAHEYRENRRKSTQSPTLHTQPPSSPPPPPLTMDIPSVRFQPVPVMAQA